MHGTVLGLSGLNSLVQPRAAFQAIMRSLADLGSLLEQRGGSREADATVASLITSLRHAKDVVERMPDPTSFYDGKHMAAVDYTKYHGNLLFSSELDSAAGLSVEVGGAERSRQHFQKPAQPLLRYILQELTKMSDTQLQVTARKAFLIQQNDGIVALLRRMSLGQEPVPKLDFWDEAEAGTSSPGPAGSPGAGSGSVTEISAPQPADSQQFSPTNSRPRPLGTAHPDGELQGSNVVQSAEAAYEARYRSIAGKLAARIELSRAIKLSLPRGQVYPPDPVLSAEEYLDTLLHSMPNNEEEVERNPLWGPPAIYTGMCLFLLQRAGRAPAFMSLFTPGRHALCPFGIRPYTIAPRRLPDQAPKLRLALSDAVRRTCRAEPNRRDTLSAMRRHLWSSPTALRRLPPEYLQAFAKAVIIPFIEVLGPVPSDFQSANPDARADATADARPQESAPLAQSGDHPAPQGPQGGAPHSEPADNAAVGGTTAAASPDRPTPPPALGLSLQAAGFRDVPLDSHNSQGQQNPSVSQDVASLASGPGPNLLRHLFEALPTYQLRGAALWKVLRCGEEEVLLLDMEDSTGLVVFGFHYLSDSN